MGKAVVDELYALSKRQYATFTDLLWTLSHHSSLDTRQLDILIKIECSEIWCHQMYLEIQALQPLSLPTR